MKKNSSTTHLPQQPKIQTAQGWQQMITKAKQATIGSKETKPDVKDKVAKNKEKK